MNKSEIVSNHSKKVSYLKKQDIEEGVSVLLDKLSSSLGNKDRIEIRGFGSFSCRKRGARLGRNPKTGTSISVSSKYYPYFRASKSLKQNLNK